MISAAQIRTIIFALIGLGAMVWLVDTYKRPTTIIIEGCKYEKHTEPNGSTWLVHIDTCGCTSIMNEKQFEFEK